MVTMPRTMAFDGAGGKEPADGGSDGKEPADVIEHTVKARDGCNGLHGYHVWFVFS